MNSCAKGEFKAGNSRILRVGRHGIQDFGGEGQLTLMKEGTANPGIKVWLIAPEASGRVRPGRSPSLAGRSQPSDIREKRYPARMPSWIVWLQINCNVVPLSHLLGTFAFEIKVEPAVMLGVGIFGIDSDRCQEHPGRASPIFMIPGQSAAQRVQLLNKRDGNEIGNVFLSGLTTVEQRLCRMLSGGLGALGAACRRQVMLKEDSMDIKTFGWGDWIEDPIPCNKIPENLVQPARRIKEHVGESVLRKLVKLRDAELIHN
jgi:hypothetical protein